ncbi:MAG: hypothetical protein AB1418_07060 [Pseudomonadota bacterium]
MNPELLSALNAHFSREPGAGPAGTPNLKQMLFERLLSSVDESPGRTEEAERAWQQAQKQLAALRRSQRELRALLGYVGETFGACPRCWGTRSDCPHCHGLGHPGKYPVQRAEFLAWVEPALNPLGLQLTPLAGGDPEEVETHHFFNATERKAS